ncbi:hypothetical protein [Phenylobacterium sp.]|uniref:hypothetical protein n=1 Tax=Phenylobacterium sp. TaxID=1871053 RepID=UPI002E32B307|nr:hypothetical protein [Phenylobacterium sp.]HEX3366555.1 hypothetical protein [Phenylobacterium sp.]
MAKAPKLVRGALWILPLALVPVAFVAAIPWLRTISHPMAILVAAALVIFGMSYANYLSFRAQRGLDEVQKAGGAFAGQWGAPAGQAAFGLLLVLPPFRDFAVAVVSKFPVRPGMTVDGSVVVVSLAFGLCGIVLLQAIGTVVVHTIWWRVKR